MIFAASGQYMYGLGIAVTERAAGESAVIDLFGGLALLVGN